MSLAKSLKPAVLAVLAIAVVSFGCAVPAAALPIVYTISGTGSWQVTTLGNSGGTFVFKFDGGDTDTIAAPSGGFQFANSPMAGSITLTNGGGPFYSGTLTSGSQMTLNQTAGFIALFNQVPFQETFGFSDPLLTTHTLTDIGFSVAIALANLSGVPSLLPVQNADGSAFFSLLSVSSLTFSEDVGTSATPLPGALPLFASGLAGSGHDRLAPQAQGNRRG